MRLFLPALVLTVACAPPEMPHAPGEAGPHLVGHTTDEIVDSARADRTIPLQIWYPAADGADAGTPTSYELAAGIGLESALAFEDAAPASGSYPLLVFSHGYEAINTQSVELTEALASHGFVVVAPEHVGNSQGSPGDAFEVAAAKRVPDVSFVIDTMLDGSDVAGGTLAGMSDPDHIGVIGHSFGGMTSLGAASGWADAPADPRVDAIVPISAVVDANLQADERDHPFAELTAEQLGTATVPVLLVGGSLDVDVPPENNDLAWDRLTAAPAVYELLIDGATHTSFANVCQIGELLLDLGFEKTAWSVLGAEDLLGPYAETCEGEALDYKEVARILNTYSVAFFRRYLLEEEAYAQVLTERWAEDEAAVTFRGR